MRGMTFDKVCGDFRVEVSLPHPWWVTISRDGETIRSFRSDDLPDLIYLLEQASSAVKADELRIERLHAGR